MNRLKELRKEKKLSQKEIAKKLSFPLRTYQRMENGESQIKPDKAKALADYFGVSVGYLLGYTDISKQYDDEKVDDFGIQISTFSNKRLEDEAFNAFVEFINNSHFVISNKQIDILFNLIKTFDEASNIYLDMFEATEAEKMFEQLIDSEQYSLIKK